MRRTGLVIGLAIGFDGGRAVAYCPSYTASSPANSHNCAIEAAPGENPSIAEWNAIFATVSAGPAVWGSAGPFVADLSSGCDQTTTVPARFPCELLKAIAMIESGWRQFCIPETPIDQVGMPSRTIISFDCGYGIGQITSGMHVGENPSFDRERVASDPTYNLATGTSILADKWRAVACVGDRQPTIIENWYSATWAYNGLAFSNNPNNPNFASNRGSWNPSVGGAAPYQEKVFGYIEHATRWAPIDVAYPDRADIGMGKAPGRLPEPSCATPTDCVHRRSTHTTACGPMVPSPDAGSDGSDAPPLGASVDAPSGSAPVNGGCSISWRPDPDRAPVAAADAARLCGLCAMLGAMRRRASNARHRRR